MAKTKPERASELVEEQLHDNIRELERHLQADVLTYFYDLVFDSDHAVRETIEERKKRRSKLAIVLETDGGYIEVTDRIVHVIRKLYRRVSFVVPNFAMSAGTVLVMSGDEIWMDYFSILGPIDPQVRRPGTNQPVPALGYLEQYDRLIEKSRKGTLTTAEAGFLIEKFDPAELYSYEQARELSVSLLKEWLAKYKFRNWKTTEKRGLPVTPKMRRERAEQIARKLSDTKRWRSHGRGIPMSVLKRELKLKIRDFGAEKDLNRSLRRYYKLLRDYMLRLGFAGVIHTPGHFVPLIR